MQRYAHYPPQCTRTALFAVGIDDVQLEDLAAGRHNRALAVCEQLLAVVPDDTQVDHLAERLRRDDRGRQRGRLLRWTWHRGLSLRMVETRDQSRFPASRGRARRETTRQQWRTASRNQSTRSRTVFTIISMTIAIVDR